MHCLGGVNPPLIDYGCTDKLEADDTFILCSDGLWAYFNDYEMGSILAENPPRAASEQLISQARAQGNGRGDNCSLAIVKLTYFEEEKPAPPPPRPKPVAPPVVKKPEPPPEPEKKKGVFGSLFGKK